jgi:hypothetical protein
MMAKPNQIKILNNKIPMNPPANFLYTWNPSSIYFPRLKEIGLSAIAYSSSFVIGENI